MKLIYIGTRDKDGIGEIVVKEGETGHVWPLPPRLDLFNHSPTGLEWGYGGSGPSQAALAIMATHLLRKENWPPVMKALKIMTLPEERLGVDDHEYLAICIYQRFKAAVIAGLPEEGWELTEDEINKAIGEL
jgi:hypothetical protein